MIELSVVSGWKKLQKVQNGALFIYFSECSWNCFADVLHAHISGAFIGMFSALRRV